MKLPDTYFPLSSRSVISVSGSEREAFLQGLITNDVTKVDTATTIYALMLTPQGKYLYDFFISEHNGTYLIDCNATLKASIIKRLSMYKLRSDVQVTDASDQYKIVAAVGEKAMNLPSPACEGHTQISSNTLMYIDPRHISVGIRAYILQNGESEPFASLGYKEEEESAYEHHRITCGIPSGDTDMVSGDTFPLDFRMDHFHAISYTKGCYVGQEVTARVHHRGKVRKKPYLVSADQHLPTSKDEVILSPSEKKLGKLCSTNTTTGLALLDSEAVESAQYQGILSSNQQPIQIKEIPPFAETPHGS
jgi:hypothetical protein